MGIRKKLDQYKIDSIIEFYYKGNSITTTAMRFNISRQVVHYHLKKAKVSRSYMQRTKGWSQYDTKGVENDNDKNP